MKEGFGEAKITINLDGIDDILKKYKKIQKYKKSSLYTIKSIDGTENVISSLIKEYKEDPI